MNHPDTNGTGLLAPSPATNGTGTPSRGPRIQGALPTRERRPGYIALLVALIVGLAAVGAVLYLKAGAKTDVIIVVREVPAGHPVSRADLSTVAVSGDVTAIAASGLSGVIGQTASVEILPRTLLQRAMLTLAGPLGPGEALVGVAVSAGQLPADGLNAGDTVQVVQLPPKDTPPTAGAAAAATVLVAAARVFSAHADPSSAGGTVVSLIVATGQSTAIAAASAAGLIALVQVAGS